MDMVEDDVLGFLRYAELVCFAAASAGKLVVYTHFALSSVASFNSCVLSTLLF